ncbi:MAG TPA: FtsQ-type POTRA domain-containing protein [Candidatus Saccharimonadales bacterium]|jgi:cell division protein FtsQ|nr:FtsQ-type POTRA domain-containing protein [Candidatus Saccharimonadales bacterium]
MAVNNFNGEDDARKPAAARDSAELPDRASAHTIEFDDDLDAQFLRTEKRVPVRRSALPKKARAQVKIIFSVVLAVLMGCAAAVAAYRYGTTSWRFRIESSDNIEVTGVQNAPRGLVMDVASSDIRRNIFAVPLEERRKQLEAIPWVESASVMRLLPNRIAVHIQERTPVAFVQIGSKVSLIDSQGVVMGMSATRQARYSFPVVRGITETEPLSSRAAAMKIFNRLVRELDSEGANYSQELSEVDLSDPENVKVTANGAGGAVMIFLGPSDFLARFKLYVGHVGEWRQQFQNLQSVDLRYEGQIIVNPDATRGTQAETAASPVAQSRKK